MLKKFKLLLVVRSLLTMSRLFMGSLERKGSQLYGLPVRIELTGFL